MNTLYPSLVMARQAQAEAAKRGIKLNDLMIGAVRGLNDMTPAGQYMDAVQKDSYQPGAGYGLAALLASVFQPGVKGKAKAAKRFIGYHGSVDDVKNPRGLFWLSREPSLANEYAMFSSGNGQNVGKYVAEVDAPFNADMMPKRLNVRQFFFKLRQQAEESGRKITKKEYEEMKKIESRLSGAASYNGKLLDYDRHEFWHRPDELFYGGASDDIEDAFKIAGFDSITMTENGIETLGVFAGK